MQYFCLRRFGLRRCQIKMSELWCSLGCFFVFFLRLPLAPTLKLCAAGGSWPFLVGQHFCLRVRMEQRHGEYTGFRSLTAMWTCLGLVIRLSDTHIGWSDGEMTPSSSVQWQFDRWMAFRFLAFLSSLIAQNRDKPFSILWVSQWFHYLTSPCEWISSIDEPTVR